MVIDRESNRIYRDGSGKRYITKEQDKSMNRDEGCYQLPHIYDYLLSATVTPGGQAAAVAETSTKTMNIKVVF